MQSSDCISAVNVEKHKGSIIADIVSGHLYKTITINRQMLADASNELESGFHEKQTEFAFA